MAHERTPKNAHGSFCVFKDECISCRAKIEAEAPGLMAYDEDHSSCFFERQPTTPGGIPGHPRGLGILLWRSAIRRVDAGDDPALVFATRRSYGV
jgi:hypothetical protein